MTNRVVVKQGDLAPTVRVQVLDPTNAPTSLADALELEFRMTPVVEGLTGDVSGAATLPLADKSVIDYAWQAGDTDVVGLYRGEFRARYAGGWKTVPTDGYISVSVEKGAFA